MDGGVCTVIMRPADRAQKLRLARRPEASSPILSGVGDAEFIAGPQNLTQRIRSTEDANLRHDMFSGDMAA
jgi:hypothetical protein